MQGKNKGKIFKFIFLISFLLSTVLIVAMFVNGILVNLGYSLSRTLVETGSKFAWGLIGLGFVSFWIWLMLNKGEESQQ